MGAEVKRILGAKDASWSIEQMADALRTRMCHKLSLPCEKGGCVSRELALAVFHEADKAYCEFFGGAEGGEAGHKLKYYPLMHEILTRLQAARNESRPTLVVFSGHDNVI